MIDTKGVNTKMNVMKSTEGFSIGSIIGVVVGIIVLVAVAVPVVTQTVTAQNFTPNSTNDVIGDNLTTLLMVGAIILVVSLYNVSA
jgi:peptidoglycan biosynthesis protein MviN/MurJ (putative lipid II flippase)